MPSETKCIQTLKDFTPHWNQLFTEASESPSKQPPTTSFPSESAFPGVTYVVSGIAAAGYSSSDAESLAAATMAQQRLLNNMPTCYEQHSIQRVFEEAMSYW